MELKDSGTLSYAATPIALDVNILQNGAMNILRELANLKLISINYKQKTAFAPARVEAESVDKFCGAWESEKTAEDIAMEIRKSRISSKAIEEF
jgi:hypothetical protein